MGRQGAPVSAGWRAVCSSAHLQFVFGGGWTCVCRSWAGRDSLVRQAVEGGQAARGSLGRHQPHGPSLVAGRGMLQEASATSREQPLLPGTQVTAAVPVRQLAHLRRCWGWDTPCRTVSSPLIACLGVALGPMYPRRLFLWSGLQRPRPPFGPALCNCAVRERTLWLPGHRKSVYCAAMAAHRRETGT